MQYVYTVYFPFLFIFFTYTRKFKYDFVSEEARRIATCIYNMFIIKLDRYCSLVYSGLLWNVYSRFFFYLSHLNAKQTFCTNSEFLFLIQINNISFIDYFIYYMYIYTMNCTFQLLTNILYIQKILIHCHVLNFSLLISVSAFSLLHYVQSKLPNLCKWQLYKSCIKFCTDTRAFIV